MLDLDLQAIVRERREQPETNTVVRESQEQRAVEGSEASKRKPESPRSRLDPKLQRGLLKEDAGGSGPLEDRIRAHQPLSRQASSGSLKAAKSKPAVNVKGLFRLT